MFEQLGLGSRSFDDGAIRRKIAPENRETARSKDRVFQRTDDVRVVIFRRDDIFAQRPSRDRKTLQVQMRRSRLQQCWQAARVVEVFHEVFAAGSDIGEQGGRARKAVKIVQRDPNASAIGEGDKVYDGIG